MILLIGFEKFGDYPQNISKQIVIDFPNKIKNQSIVKRVLPISWKESIRVYKQIIGRSKFILIILTGIYSGKEILIEKYGWNIAFGIDNYHKFKIGPVKFLKPLRLKSGLDFSKINTQIGEIDIVSLSSYPGFYLCNFLYYWALYLAKSRYPVVFIHLPVKKSIGIVKDKFHKIVSVIYHSLK